MKTTFKYWLSRAGFFPVLDLTRRLPEVVRWVGGGASGVAPPPVKRMVISAYLARFGLTHFFETGTHLGDTLAYVARNSGIQATSIELDDAYYSAALRRFSGYGNVNLLHGDSGKLLPELVSQLRSPALFWLDGHYSGGDTGRAKLDTPVSAELEAILNSPINGHVILIDDARCFDGSQDYPHLDRLLEIVRRSDSYSVEVSADIIRLTPRRS